MEVFIKVMNGLVMILEDGQEIFMCLAALLYEPFLPIREWRCQDIDQVLLHEDHFFSVASIRSKLPTAAC